MYSSFILYDILSVLQKVLLSMIQTLSESCQALSWLDRMSPLFKGSCSGYSRVICELYNFPKTLNLVHRTTGAFKYVF